MRIVVYIEPLKTFTTGMPHRGMLKELINIRKCDYFILVLRGGIIPDYLKNLLKELEVFNNWELKTERRTRKISNLLALFKSKNHCQIRYNGDIFLNLDADYLGSNNVPQIITVHDLSSVKKTGTSSISFIKKAARKFTIMNGIRYANYIVSISQFTKNDILSEFKITKPITVIHNGIDPKWHNIKSKRCNPQENYWIWWGGFSKRKNLKNLITSYELLLKDHPAFFNHIPSILFIGSKNNYYNELLQMIERSDILKQKIIFKNQLELDELIDYVANSKGLLFPSLYEGFGLPVIEAFSQGIPVLTSNISSLPEISGGLAILVNPHDIFSIKEGMKKLLKEESIQIRTKLEKWSTKFTYKQCALEYSNLIDKIDIK